jgi:hypothetical protein
MKLSLNWINDYVNISDLNLIWIFDKLNVEIESIVKVQDDTIINIGDDNFLRKLGLSSHYDIAKEISIITGRELKDIDCFNEGYLRSASCSIIKPIPQKVSKCLRQCAIKLEDISLRTSPEAISSRLESFEIDTVNLMLDLAEYVFLDIGVKINVNINFKEAVVEAIISPGDNKDISFAAIAVCRYVKLLFEYEYETKIASAFYDKVYNTPSVGEFMIHSKYDSCKVQL